MFLPPSTAPGHNIPLFVIVLTPLLVSFLPAPLTIARVSLFCLSFSLNGISLSCLSRLLLLLVSGSDRSRITGSGAVRGRRARSMHTVFAHCQSRGTGSGPDCALIRVSSPVKALLDQLVVNMSDHFGLGVSVCLGRLPDSLAQPTFAPAVGRTSCHPPARERVPPPNGDSTPKTRSHARPRRDSATLMQIPSI